MSRIELPEGWPGIQALMSFRPQTAEPLNELAEALLWADNSLTRAERELIATYVAFRDGCVFAHRIHGAIAAHQLGGDEELVEAVRHDFTSADVSSKLKSLLVIAEQVRQGGGKVTTEAVQKARDQGATDTEIHDTVLIAAAFCMYARYIDGLAPWTPDDPDLYRRLGAQCAENGFVSVGRARMAQIAE